MDIVNRNFSIYKSIEIALLATSIILTYLFANSTFIFSLGHGLIIQSSFMLVLDLFAEIRAQEYVNHIQNLI